MRRRGGASIALRRGAGRRRFVGVGRRPRPKAIPPPKGLPAFYSVPQPLPDHGGQAREVAEGRGARAARNDLPRDVRVAERAQQAGRGHRRDRGAERHAARGRVPRGVVGPRHQRHGRRVRAVAVARRRMCRSTNELLDQGWVVTASDYQGEGTPGLMPYLAGVSAARNTIDIVRAARQLPAAHASKRYVVWGHSEGGQTAMFALQHRRRRTRRRCQLEGVVAGAPPSQFGLIYTFLKNEPVPLLPADGRGRAERGVRQHGRAARQGAHAARAASTSRISTRAAPATSCSSSAASPRRSW